jgi:hypothetical protein
MAVEFFNGNIFLIATKPADQILDFLMEAAPLPYSLKATTTAE